jgi:DNA primase|tara:strand:- start:3186 stop:4124 length:939 start_codon:yes stop_codon:yes gene_type:complete
MNQNLFNLLDRVIGSRGRKLKKLDEYLYWSPFVSHHKPKLQINVKTQKWHCWVSNEGGHTFFQLFKKLNATNEQFYELRNLVDETIWVESTPTKKEHLKLPEEFRALWNGGNNFIKKHALNYLQKRNVTEQDILKYNIGYCDGGMYSNRIIIPSYDVNGKLNFFVGRDFYNSKMKYRNSPTTKDIIGFELFVNWDEPIVLCEGPFDAIAIKRNAIPLFGKTVMNSLKKKIYENKVKTIYVALDEDATVDSVKMTEDFIRNGIDVYLMKLSKKDPSDIGFESFIYLLNESKQTTFSDLIKLKLNDKRKRYMEI